MDTELLKKVLLYIDEHIQEKISLSELAEVAGYSPFYFSKLFAEAMGMPVTACIRLRKMQYALCSLLEGMKVLDVSLMYSFDSHEGFTRAFTQLFGSTPSIVRRYLDAYSVPEWVMPNTKERSTIMGVDTSTLFENMHEMVFEVLRTSLEEAEAGFCTEIRIAFLADGRIKIADNGRGIPLSKDLKVSKNVLEKILAGHPISNMEYAEMGDFAGCGMQTVNSLCESLQVFVYRDEMVFQQDYVRGIAQHDLICRESEHPSGMELVFKPDRQIFGDIQFSMETLKDWIKKNVTDKVAVIWE